MAVSTWREGNQAGDWAALARATAHLREQSRATSTGERAESHQRARRRLRACIWTADQHGLSLEDMVEAMCAGDPEQPAAQHRATVREALGPGES